MARRQKKVSSRKAIVTRPGRLLPVRPSRAEEGLEPKGNCDPEVAGHRPGSSDEAEEGLEPKGNCDPGAETMSPAATNQAEEGLEPKGNCDATTLTGPV